MRAGQLSLIQVILMPHQTIIIDDDPVFAGYMTGLLEAAGLENIVCVGDAWLTLQSSAPENYARIVCDLNMPDMDGIEFIQHLAKMKWPGELIIASGEAQSVVNAAERLARLSGLNVIGTLRKPAKLEDVQHILKTSANKSKAITNLEVEDKRAELILQAIELAAVMPVYQPQLNLKTMKVDGFEALMRLKLSDGSLATPGEFFDLLSQEQADLLAVKQNKIIVDNFRDWSAGGHSKKCSINLSPRQVGEDHITKNLIEICQHMSVDPAQITIEVTENEPLIDAPNLIGAMSRLRIAGFGLALDDFGSGHANIQELGWFPFSEIKTDLVFGQDLLTDQFSRAAIEFAVKASRQLELQLTVEGLESAEAVAFAAKLGANKGQGYAIARPISFENAHRLAIAS